MMEIEEKELALEQPTAHGLSVWEWGSLLLSVVFNPLLMPLYVFILLFRFTYLAIMPLSYCQFVLGMAVTFTALAPILFIGAYLGINKLGFRGLAERRRRVVPYLMVMLSYLACCILMERMHFPRYLSGMLVAALMGTMICFLMNFRWRISAHLAGCGLFIGALLAYSYLFHFNPVWWLCGFILLAGIQGTARISYHQHTLLEVIVGFVVGMFCGIVGILFI